MERDMEQIFNKVGKKTPYLVPDNYFEQISERLVSDAMLTDKACLSEDKTALSVNKPKRRNLKIYWYSSVASVAAILLCVFLLTPMKKVNPHEEYAATLNDYCNAISEAEQADEATMLAELDIFLQY